MFKALRNIVLITCVLFASACADATHGELETRINPELAPGQTSIPDVKGNAQPIAASRDGQGVQSDFVEGVLLVKPANPSALQSFLDRYQGTVIGDDTIPEPPASLGITLTEEQRAPTEFTVRISLSTIDLASLQAHAAELGLDGSMEFSSEAAAQTFAGVLDAKVRGFEARADYVAYTDQTFPTALFNTQERPAGAAFTDAMTSAPYVQANLPRAWQFVAAHGIARRVRVAILDGGFYLDTAGRALGGDSDFPAAPIVPAQYDFAGDDYIADGPAIMNCSGGSLCNWHGTGSTGVAAGVMNNQLGSAGAGSQVADPILFKLGGTKSQRNRAIRTAAAWGADVASMSFGGDCNLGCRLTDREQTPFDDAIDSGNKIVFVASAGNGRGNPLAGYDVVEPSFVHPCIEDHVICIGALANGTTKQGYSNFGDRVQLFAPTNIAVMSYPSSSDGMGNPLPVYGAAVPQSFGGTSASAPLVAGVVAMMKAINPNLGNDDVARILIETAGPGGPQVTRTLDAYAAVRRAAEGIVKVPDAIDGSDSEMTPFDLGPVPPYTRSNLNIDARERDYLQVNSPNGSIMTVNLQYPGTLGAISAFDPQPLSGACGTPSLITDAAITNGRTLTYNVPGGPLALTLLGTDINAYNLGITFTSATYPRDDYEPNDTAATARYLYSFKSAGQGLFAHLAIDPHARIDATIHRAGDVDYYVVRAVHPTLAEQILFSGGPALKVYGNDSPLTLEVYELRPDGTQGALVQRIDGASCTKEALTVRLTADASYLVVVSGTPGRYTLSNGITGEERYLPSLVHDHVYEVLHPGDPVEHVLRYPELYVFLPDRSYSGVQMDSPRAHLKMYDFDGAPAIEGALISGRAYVLEVTRADNEVEPPLLRLTWEAATPQRTGDNLILNSGAEITGGDLEDDFAGWDLVEGLSQPRLYFYDEQIENPSRTSPGPEDRGDHLFAGGAFATSGLEQTIVIAPEWSAAINEGRVHARFAAFLGGNLADRDHANAKLTFLDANRAPLGEVFLPTIDARIRGDQTGLFPVEQRELVPAGAAIVLIDVVFVREDGDFNDAYADNFELTFSEW